MFNKKAYIRVLEEIKREGIFHGKPVKSLENIYRELEDYVPRSIESFKSWKRPKSNGPRDLVVLEDLETALGIPLGSLTIKEETITQNENSTETTEEETIMQKNNVTDFNKERIFHCYNVMKNYLQDDDVESEECFNCMYDEIEKCKVAIPTAVFEKISNFIDEKLAPIVYESEKTFAECYTDEIGYYNDENIWQTRDEEATRKMCMAFIVKLAEIEQELDNFAMNELSPVLV